MEFQKIKKEATANISSFDWRDFKDAELKRLIKFYYSQGNNMDTEDLKRVSIQNQLFYTLKMDENLSHTRYNKYELFFKDEWVGKFYGEYV